ncbi:RHS repeat-associated core domain-containing protein [Flavisolibacter nicotianae]|uniref:RHS repeat-associated core domain-containing protein n=1 Tax=Flavisolibacter nicotianae TaxID=2364882 RepID=UPI000EAD27E3|nr:RHS repeat-associated core domain-containing protein [Flavisolibacter nicotianae]
MKLPGRSGALSASGLWQEAGSSTALPANPVYDSRTGNQPLEYKATESISFVEGFESGVNDAFEAYITTDNGSGSGSGGSGASLYADGGYRYGFNGKEQDSEISGDGNQYDYGFRIYNPRLGRFLSVDPLTKGYPMLTPYQYASNRPVNGIDLDGLEFLSFQKSMYRMQFSVSSTNNVSTTSTILQTVYENIPAALQDAKMQSFKFVNGGPVTTKGRDYNSTLDGAIVYDANKYYGRQTPGFNGLPPGSAPEPTDATKPVGSYYGDDPAWGSSGPAQISAGASGAKEGVEIAQNVSNISIWDALYDESNLRRGFYNATNTIDAYMAINPKTGKNYFGDELKGADQRVMLVNFLSDGYLPTAETDQFTGSEYSKIRREAFGRQLTVAWHGLQVMQAQGIKIQDKTKSAVNDVLKKYKADGGGNEYDKISQYTSTQKQ